jgi:hypothetical protein
LVAADVNRSLSSYITAPSEPRPTELLSPY